MTTDLSDVVHLCESPLGVEDYLQVGSGLGRKVLVIGEAPAPNGWRLSGRAFYTQAGRLLPSGSRLNELLEPYGMDIGSVAFTELVKCFVGSRRALLRSCGAKTWDLLQAQVDMVDPHLVIVLGKATHSTLEHCSGVSLPFGEVAPIFLGGKKRQLLSIFHPSPISPTSRVRNREIFQRSDDDLRELLAPAE
jgi:uracil-DNA glycosylase family 4